jgi:glycosyltransferase involved in cell wall biosynthesis
MNNLKISVALCTFNGERYLSQQLDSILNQVRLPDELIVCDDKSSDNTVSILKIFKDKAPFTMRIVINESNLRSTKNFENAISLCSGDLIALADQDDLWLPDKLRKIEEVFTNSPEVGMVFTDAEVVNEECQSVGYTLWQRIKFTKKEQSTFASKPGDILQILLRRNVVTGATMCFKSSLRSYFIPIPSLWVHDAWIAVMLTFYKVRIEAISSCLIAYRQHHTQQIGAKKQNLLVKALNSIFSASLSTEHESELQRLLVLKQEISSKLSSSLSTDILNNNIIFFNKRNSLINSNLFIAIVLMINELIRGNYNIYGNGFKSMARDVTMTLSLIKSRNM